MSQVAIIGATLSGNRGAEAMISTLIGRLREVVESPLDAHVYSYYPSDDRAIVTDSSVTIHSSTPLYLVAVLVPTSIMLRLIRGLNLCALERFMPKATRALGGSDVLVCLSGVSFVDGREKFLPFNLATLLPAMILGIPVVKCSQALGPFESLLNRVAGRSTLQRCAQVFTRGAETDRHVRGLLTDHSRVQRSDDLAFLMRPEFTMTSSGGSVSETLRALERARADERLIVGVCPSSVVAIKAQRAGWDYCARMAEVISEAVREDHTVVIYPNATRQRHMSTLRNNDLPVIAGITAGLSPDVRRRIIAIEGDLNAVDIHEVIDACDVHLVARFHAMVASLSNCKPVAVVGWSHKYREVMAPFGQDDLVVDYRNGDLPAMMTVLRRLVDERVVRAEQIRAALPHIRSSAQIQIDDLAERMVSATA